MRSWRNRQTRTFEGRVGNRMGSSPIDRTTSFNIALIVFYRSDILFQLLIDGVFSMIKNKKREYISKIKMLEDELKDQEFFLSEIKARIDKLKRAVENMDDDGLEQNSDDFHS